MLATDIGTMLAQKLSQKASEVTKANDLTTMEWGRKYTPEYFFRSSSLLHTTLAQISDELKVNRGRNILVIAPRGNAKSTLCSFVVPLKAICEGSEKYILLIADTGDQAAKYLESLKSELLTNEDLARDYPLACTKGPKWNADSIITGNGVCIEAIGKGAAVRGRKYKKYRPTLVIVDDPQSDEDCESPNTRVKDLAWFNKSLMPVGDTDTNIFCVGTMIHRECIVGALEKRADFKSVKFASIIAWPTNMNLWEEWSPLYFFDPKGAVEFYEANKEAMHEGAEVLWAEKEDIYSLMCLRENLGSPAFQSEKQNDPRDPSKTEFKEEWLAEDRAGIWYKTVPTGKKYINVGYGDPAMGGETKRHDDSAIISLQYDPEIRKCFVDCDIKKRPIVDFVDAMIRINNVYKHEAFGLETNGFQALILPELEMKAPLFPVYQVENRVNKLARISRLGIWLQRGFFVFKMGCKDTRKLIEQLLDHPHALHDDGSDSLEGATRTLSSVISIDVDTNETEVTYADDGLGDNLLDAR